jgi:NAD(P)-dependent dehydrogenase (short-subunit alcohol dehydrogenase family)
MRTVVITGANAGLGFQAALALAREGVRVVMACRSTERAQQAQRDLLNIVPDGRTLVLPLDVAEPDSIREFGMRMSDEVDALDVLINNAGIVGTPLLRNRVGHEMQMTTNYLGAFALTGVLLPLFRRDAESRIVNVGSLSHRVARLDLDDLNWEQTPYSPWKAYARSKLAMLTFTMELGRRLRARAAQIIAVGAHPGFAATEIGKDLPVLNSPNPVVQWLKKKTRPMIPPPAVATGPILHAACAEGVQSGDFYGPDGFLEIRGLPGKARLNPEAKDATTGRRLWSLSESLCGIRYLSDAPGEHAR